ncbi:lysophospholipase [Halalkalibacter wakoensis JCM 9140]|uniref:Lysophospholipase n=1 Tax=Halalkalibacter wakoensis JCM 9140 TaxID=1236970 RepID=W4Q3R8_9BACI|nr:alpha/beta hydrolase [Halalkalibacter wakoensis]GAE26368.1 lysophospholipase [Halalkalibacter wakoensis JCM 9140]
MIETAIDKIRSECLSFGEKSLHMETYRQYYDLSFQEGLHDYGYITTSGFDLFVQQFRPPVCKERVFLLHGYLDHAGSLNKTIRMLVENHYEVIVYDLPGHGLSSGERLTINSFEEYFHTAKGIFDFFFKDVSPLLVAHSTGGAIALTLVKNKDASFSKMVLVAPLFRPHLWRLSKIGLFITRPFLKDLRRVFSRNSGDEAYLAFTKQDPLQEKMLPVSWLKALGNWLQLENNQPYEDIRFLMIQGSGDRTVNVGYGEKRVKSIYLIAKS